MLRCYFVTVLRRAVSDQQSAVSGQQTAKGAEATEPTGATEKKVSGPSGRQWPQWALTQSPTTVHYLTDGFRSVAPVATASILR